MPNTLQTKLAELADTFAAQVLAAIRGASLDDLVSESRRTLPAPSRRAAASPPASPPASAPAAAASAPRKVIPGRLPRRSPDEIRAHVQQVVALLAGKKDGLRSEHIQSALGFDKRELPRVLKAGLASKALRSKGARRSTTYFAS